MRESQNLGFFSTILFLLIAFYMFAAVVHGNIKFGLRFFKWTFYPMVPGETFVNTFLVNALLMNLYTPALVYFITELYR